MRSSVGFDLVLAIDITTAMHGQKHADSLATVLARTCFRRRKILRTRQQAAAFRIRRFIGDSRSGKSGPPACCDTNNACPAYSRSPSAGGNHRAMLQQERIEIANDAGLVEGCSPFRILLGGLLQWTMSRLLLRPPDLPQIHSQIRDLNVWTQLVQLWLYDALAYSILAASLLHLRHHLSNQ